MTESKALQDQYWPSGQCFGCGPANTKGLRIKSVPEGNELVAEWKPEKHHEAFDGCVNGGIIGALLDCHSNWAAAWHLKNKTGADALPCTVTADYAIVLKRPTPSAGTLTMKARVVESTDDKAIVEAELFGGGKLCATCRGTFVAVKPGHPAFHRW